MRWAGEFVKIPFLINGRSKSGCDCWGLYRLIVLERSGVELPEYPEQTTISQMRKMIEKSGSQD